MRKSFIKIRRYKAPANKAVWDLMNKTLEAAGVHAGKGPWDDDMHNIETVYNKKEGDFLVAVSDCMKKLS